MYKAARASVLVLLLACHARAGWAQNEVAALPPSSPQTGAVQEPTTAAQGPAGGEASDDDLSYGLAEIALDLLAVLPPLV